MASISDRSPVRKAATRAPALRQLEVRLRRERNGSRSGERRCERGEDAQVGVERDPLKPSHAERAVKVMLDRMQMIGATGINTYGLPRSEADLRLQAV
ncbi:MAG: hypothetical protein M3R39_06770 [Actinomycetota bacterium]|nr:hypothetical protein [Actinomycetota bacterium]